MKLFDRLFGFLVVATAAATCSSAALAQAGPAASACRADASAHCAGTRPGGGRIAACLKQHEAQLSPDCKAQIGVIGECSQQVQKLCGPEVSTPAALRDCFKARPGEFSTSCRSLMATP
jgi:Cysteine rich repeat